MNLLARETRVLGALSLACACLVVGCGDNSKQCGPGTTENNGVCEPDGTVDIVCSDGTRLDELTKECVPDDSVCGNGTVLINGVCQDPTAGLTVDLMEGPEPNGFELDATPAGLAEVKDVGTPYVIKGCVTPVDNNSPDLDVYVLDVDGPTLIHIAADGVQGLAAGFIMFGDDPRLSSWFRMGLNVTTDTSKREVWLPVAGRYQLVMTDTRTLLPITQNGEGFPAAGNPDGTSCYFVTINQRTVPSPTALDLNNPNTGTIGEDLKFFTAAFPTGFTTMIAVIDPEDLDGDGISDFDSLGNLLDSRASSSLVLMNNNQLRQADVSGRGIPADSPVSDIIFGGIKAGDEPRIILDYAWNFTVEPADYEVRVIDQTSSQALSTTGAVVNATSNGQFFAEDNVPHFENVNLFHFDVATGGEIDAMDLTFSIPVSGSLLDQDGFTTSPFSGLTSEIGGVPAITTFTTYKGLVRAFGPGRHYFMVFAPRDPVATNFQVTSTITPLVPTALALDTPSAATAFNAVRSNVFSYNIVEPWQVLSATTQVNEVVHADIFDPAQTTPQTPGFAFGRLDTLVTTFNNSPPATKLGDGTPMFSADLETGSGSISRLLENPFSTLPADPDSFLIKVSPTVANPGTFTLTYGKAVFEDFGVATIDAGESETANATMTAGSAANFLFKTKPGHAATITVTPVGTQANLNVAIELLDRDELAFVTVDNTGNNAAESITYNHNLSGFTAFRVVGSTGTSAGDYSVAVSVAEDAYTAVQAASGFIDACVGGQVLPLNPDLSGNPADDEGLTGPIAAPSGFELHGQAVTNFKVGSNGFITFDTSLLDGLFDNTALVDTPAIAIAPHWDDLTGIQICTQATSGKRVIQWDGVDFDSFRPVQFQAILESTGKITFVYGPQHQPDGSSATIGVQQGAGVLELGFGKVVEEAASSITLTPN